MMECVILYNEPGDQIMQAFYASIRKSITTYPYIA